jgi:hypothetical protein
VILMLCFSCCCCCCISYIPGKHLGYRGQAPSS